MSAADGLLNEGIRALQSGDLETASDLLTQAVASDPDNSRAHGYLGICKARRGDLQGSIASLEEAARLQPTDANARYNLAVALIQAQAQDRARTVLQSVLDLDPNHAKARAGLQQLGASQQTQTGLASPFDLPAPTAGFSAQPAGLASYQTAATPGMAPPAQSAYPPQHAVTLTGEPVAPSAPPPQYGAPTPPSQYGREYPGQPPLYGTAPPAPPAHGSAGGMRYAPQPPAYARTMEPTTGLRIARGLGWGFLFGQWWTIWNLFWFFVWGGVGTLGKDVNVAAMGIFMGIVFVLLFGIAGSFAGFIVGAMNASIEVGAVVGIVIGLIFCGLEFLMSGANPGMLINVFFWFFTGRYVGANIAARVQRPIAVT